MPLTVSFSCCCCWGGQSVRKAMRGCRWRARPLRTVWRWSCARERPSSGRFGGWIRRGWSLMGPLGKSLWSAQMSSVSPGHGRKTFAVPCVAAFSGAQPQAVAW